MLIALQKKQENIAEYILYMWQIEDIIRACNFDTEIIKERIISPMNLNPDLEKQYTHWYGDLISKLKIQGKEKTGHLRDYDEELIELNYLHGALINMFSDEKYKNIYQEALPLINDFKTMSGNQEITDIEVCFNGLYAKLLLRLQNKEISPETEEAFQHFTKVLGYLSAKYKDMKEGKLV